MKDKIGLLILTSHSIHHERIVYPREFKRFRLADINQSFRLVWDLKKKTHPVLAFLVGLAHVIKVQISY